ncbi:MAG: 30S ribosome-binding factor RbfA [Hyphomonas sp.]
MAKRPTNPAGMPTQRQLRAGELVRHALTDVLAREDFRDPELQNIMVTVGEVRCSPDLRHANVFVTPLGDDTEDGRKSLAEALNRAASFLRGRLGKEVELKFTPQLHFIADRSYDEATAIDRLLADPKVRRDIEEG